MPRPTPVLLSSVTPMDTGLSPSLDPLPMGFSSNNFRYLAVLNPDALSVWAPPLSLAATHGIDFSFFSSGYLDVSIPQVLLLSGYVFTGRMTLFD